MLSILASFLRVWVTIPSAHFSFGNPCMPKGFSQILLTENELMCFFSFTYIRIVNPTLINCSSPSFFSCMGYVYFMLTCFSFLLKEFWCLVIFYMKTYISFYIILYWMLCDSYPLGWLYLWQWCHMALACPKWTLSVHDKLPVIALEFRKGCAIFV